MTDLSVNASLAEVIRSREALAYGRSMDGKRPDAWEVFGYSENVTFDMLMMAYKRHPAARGAVHRILDKCWQESPRIKSPSSDEETPQETKLAKEFSRLGLWRKLKDFDRRNLVGRYAGLIYKVADGLALREPLVRGSLVDVIPVYEDQLRVVAWVTDQSSQDYGNPAMFQYRVRHVGDNTDKQGKPEDWADVHPSRVQLLAEGSVGDDFLSGVSLLEAGFNSLVDLEKIGGGSAESYLKNSSRTLTVKFANTPPPMVIDPDTGDSVRLKDAIEGQVRALNSNIDKSIVLGGADVSTLQTQQHDPTGAFQLAANLFSSSVQIPFTVLFGQQTGRLASDEDKADMLARAKGRQVGELTPMLDQFVRRMQAIGAFETFEFEIEWPDLGAPTDAEKLDRALKMAQANQAAQQAGHMPYFEPNEVRKAAGYEEMPEQEPPLVVDPQGDPATQPKEQP